MFQGSIVALVTPMQNDEKMSVDVNALRRLVDFHVENQTDALVAVGTTGESATLDMDEHCEVIRLVVEHAAGRIPVIAGTGANSTTEAIELTEAAKKAGADACLLVTPYYNKPTQEGLYRHYRKLAESVDIPQILYNVPGRTACDMQPATVKRLAGIDNIIGIKEALGDLNRFKELLSFANDKFFVLSGDDALTLETIKLGSKGTISVTANIAPKLMHDMCAWALKGNYATADEINQRLMGLHQHLFIESNPIPAKWALYRMGLVGEAIRLPLVSLSEAHHATVIEAMKQAGIQV